jgi:hypothetical protein
VIYVMGAGRSGSTLLGVVLGNCENVFDAGELETWLRRSAIPNFGDTERVRFWDRVRGEVDGAGLFGDRAWLCLEHSLALFRVRDWRARRRLRERYLRVAEDLYRAIARAAGSTHVVDTSHYPLRARELQKLAGIDLYLLYLVRNPQDVVESFNRQDVDQRWKSPAATNLYLWLTHILSVTVFLRHRRDRRLLLSYEDFITDPESTLRSVLDCVDVYGGPPDLASLQTGIPFQGNRLLRTPVIALKRGVTAPPRRRRITELVQFPWSAVLSRLRPAATLAASCAHVSPPDSD